LQIRNISERLAWDEPSVGNYSWSELKKFVKSANVTEIAFQLAVLIERS